MHEISIAQEIAKIAEETLKKEGAKEFISVSVVVGKLSGIVRESLEFVFPLVLKSTPLENGKLIIIERDIQIHCNHCQEDFILQKLDHHCPKCQRSETNIVAGKEFYISKMEFN